MKKSVNEIIGEDEKKNLVKDDWKCATHKQHVNDFFFLLIIMYQPKSVIGKIFYMRNEIFFFLSLSNIVGRYALGRNINMLC